MEYPGAIYHLTVRANGRAELFDDDDDRRYLLGRIAEAASTYQVRVYLFCLMTTHFHCQGQAVAGAVATLARISVEQFPGLRRSGFARMAM